MLIDRNQEIESNEVLNKTKIETPIFEYLKTYNIVTYFFHTLSGIVLLMSAFLAVDYFKPALFIREIVLVIICLSVSILIFNYYRVTIKEKAKILKAANIIMKKSTISVLSNIIIYFIVHPIFILLLYFIINKYNHPISFDHPIVFGAVFALIIVNGSKDFAETYFTNKYGEL